MAKARVARGWNRPAAFSRMVQTASGPRKRRVAKSENNAAGPGVPGPYEVLTVGPTDPHPFPKPCIPLT